MATTTEKLDWLRATLAEARQHERELRATPAQLQAEFDRLGDELAEHDLPIDGSAPPAGATAGKLWRRRHEAQVKLDGPWAQRIDKAGREAADAEAEIARFVIHHFGDLVAEIEPDAQGAAATVSTAIAGLLAALDAWHEVADRVVSLVRYVPGLTGQDVPLLPADALRSELRRLASEPVPRPLPRSLYEEAVV